MFHFQEGRNLCQSTDILDAVALIRWVLLHPEPPSDFGHEGNVYWVEDAGEYTVLIRNQGVVSAALNMAPGSDGFIARLSSQLFNGNTCHSPTLH